MSKHVHDQDSCGHHDEPEDRVQGRMGTALNGEQGGSARSGSLEVEQAPLTGGQDPFRRGVIDPPIRHIGRPVAHPADKIEYARLLKQQGSSLGEIATKTGIPKTSVHRYLATPGPDETLNGMS